MKQEMKQYKLKVHENYSLLDQLGKHSVVILTQLSLDRLIYCQVRAKAIPNGSTEYWYAVPSKLNLRKHLWRVAT